jgi:Ca2+-binding RTX toxin-like protein
MPVVFERVVNTTTVGPQVGSNIEALADGGWIVSWRGSANPFSGVWDAYFQRYSAEGVPVGGEIIANTTRGDYLGHPVTTALTDGGWVISWAYPNGADGFVNIWQQRYDANGQPLGTEVMVNTHAPGMRDTPSISALPDGGWVTVWQSYEQNDQYLGVYQQRFDASGLPVGAETHVSTAGESNIAPVVTGLPDGGWLIAWSASNLDGSSRQIFGQRYDAQGLAVGVPTQVSTFEVAHMGLIVEPAVAALEDGGWVVSWTTAGQDSFYSDGIFQRRFTADGTPVGNEKQVNVSFVHQSQDQSSLLALPDGGWLVFWTSETNIGGDREIYARRYLSNGMAYGDDFAINTYAPFSQFNADATLLEDGSVVISWTSLNDYETPETVPYIGLGHDGNSSGIVQLWADVRPVRVGTDGDDTVSAIGEGEILLGLAGDDTLEGGSSNDTLVGGSGADSLNGGDGTRDMASYWTAMSGLYAMLLTPADNVGDAAGDSYAGIEDLEGSRFDDALGGDDLANQILGGNGDDNIEGLGGSDSLFGGAGNDVLSGGAGGDQLDGGNGTRDRVKYTGSAVGLRVDLQQPGSNTGDAAGDIFSGIEELYGSNYGDSLLGDAGGNMIWGHHGTDTMYGRGGNDSLDGGEGNDTLAGGVGADLLDGGAGTRDRAQYTDAPEGLRADLLSRSTNTGIAAGDTYVSIEDLHGSNFADTLLGDGGANMIWGGLGGDTLYGRDGNDSLYGGEGNDVLGGGVGTDRLDGGAGIRDRATYSDATVGLRIDLLSSVTNIGVAADDTYVGIEDLSGTDFNDSVLGDNGANMIWGGSGDDIVYGRGGNDTLYGGGGSDTMNGGEGTDRIDGGGGTRDRAQYTDATAGLRADLQNSATNTGFAAGDRYFGIEDLHGSNFADTLLGDVGANMIWGGLGHDVIYGRVGDDLLYGGEGNDAIGGNEGNDVLTGGAGSDIFVFDRALGTNNVDRITDFSAEFDTIRLQSSIFTALSAGTLTPAEFHVGAAATDGLQHIIYNSATGQIYYDADGTGAGAAVLFATLTSGLAMTAQQILII